MQCLSCKKKACKLEAKDCNDVHDEALSTYRSPDNQSLYRNADALVAHGRAGMLSRFDEIMEFVKAQRYKEVAVAYCFSMETLAKQVDIALRSQGIKTSSVRCSIGGVREKEIAEELGASVNCNPIGQAMCINRSTADFVIEMGLCMGHDVLFHQHLKKPFTVFVVKDRKHNNAPAEHFSSNPTIR